MKFTGLTVVVAALAGLAAASPAPLVNGKLVCGSMKDTIVTCPFGQVDDGIETDEKGGGVEVMGFDGDENIELKRL
ncbi:hypothetical protein TASIC1_0011006900 [Trichoderma asperellum]|uniref:Uncharacterized protein n=1 Tax=Trichoderma asperellum TaxID=101201 RepID=A0A6V8R341_TRIAP|nr:hypothetical protein TASIC1_0011006900 [Trichoderma asperellum]